MGNLNNQSYCNESTNFPMFGELLSASLGYLYYKSSSYFPQYHQQYITKLPEILIKKPEIVFLLFLLPLLYQLYKILFQAEHHKEEYHEREFPKYFPKLEGYPKPYPNGNFKSKKKKIFDTSFSKVGSRFAILMISNLVKLNM